MYEPAAEAEEVRGVLRLPLTSIPEDALEFCNAVTKNLEKQSNHAVGEIEGLLVPSLVLYTPALENKQLRCALKTPQKAIDGTEYTERDCGNGALCVALSIEGGPGVPLMESLHPFDFTQQLERGCTAGAQPMPCVLCRRNEVSNFFCNMLAATCRNFFSALSRLEKK